MNRVCFVLSLVLAACGDDSSPSGAGPMNPSGGPESASTPDSPATPRPGSKLSGTVWKTYNSVSGVETFSLEGGPWRSITPRLSDLTPTFDGTRYAYALAFKNPDIPFEQVPAFNNQTEIGVVDTETRQTLHQATFTASIYRPQPSPADPALVLALSEPFEFSRKPVDWIIIDVAQKLIAKRFPGHGWVAWLPDGRYLHLLANGELSVGSVVGDEVHVGTLALPVGASTGPFKVNAEGERIAVRVYSSAGSGGGVDVYVADIDGNNLERFTKTGLSTYGIWSPDGKHLAFNYDLDASCGDRISTSCAHLDCEMHYAPESARDVVIERAPEDPPRLLAKNAKGNPTFVPCNVFAWTPSSESSER